MPIAYINNDGALVKQCSRCAEIKPVSEFFKRTSLRAKDGLTPQCKRCATESKWISVAKNKDHYAIMNKDYYERNKERQARRYTEWRANASPEDRLRVALRHKYGLSLEDYKRMMAEQNDCCYLCGTHKSECRGGTLVVDHCHATMRVRRLLCHHCNCALGSAKDDPALMRKMATYLEAHGHL